MKKLFTLLILFFVMHGLFGQSIQTDVSQGCAPLKVNFSAVISDTTVKYYEWYLNSYHTTTSKDTSFTFQTAGWHTVYVYFYDKNNNYLGYSSAQIQVNGLYYLDFTSQVCPGSNVSFSAAGSGINTYNWYFGDGGTATGGYPSHSYSKTGKYPVRVIGSGSCATDTLTDTIQVVDNLPVSGYLYTSVSSHEACPGQPVSFGTYSGNGYAVNINFGDGDSIASTGTDHSYTTEGIYPVKFMFSNTCGNDSIIRDTVNISGNAPWGSVGLSHNTSNLCPGQTDEFYVNGTFKTISLSFDDGASVNGNYVNHQFSTLGTHYVQATLINYCGNDTVLKDSVMVSDANKVTGYLYYSITPKKACPGQPIDFYMYSANFYQMSVDYGDSSNLGTGTYDYKHSYADTGRYPVKLIFKNLCGNDSILRDTITVSGNTPWSSLSINESGYKLCPNENVNLSVNGIFKSLSWTFDDGTTSNGNYQTHKFSSLGIHHFQVNVIDYCGNDSILKDSVEVTGHNPISGNLYHSISSMVVCPTQPVSFEVYSDNGYKATVNYGDSSSVANGSTYYTHVYTTTGKYPVTMTYTNLCGVDSIFTDTVTVEANAPWSGIGIYKSRSSGCPGDYFDFEAQGTYKNVNWSFDDGFQSSGSSVGHRFLTEGWHHFSLQFTNYCGDDSTLKDSVNIVESNKIQGGFNFVVEETHVCPEQPVTAYAYSDNNYNSTIDFGDSTVYPGNMDDTHVYGSAGTYVVKARFTDGCGNDSILQDTVYVKENIPWGSLSLSAGDTVSCPNEPVSFWLNGTYQKAIWTFGDGSKISGSDITHTFKNPGWQKVSVTATSYCGNDTTVSDSIRIRTDIRMSGDLHLYFGDNMCPNSINYYHYYGNYAASATWNFGDGQSADGTETSHVYKSYGNYPLTLTLQNGCGIDTTLTDTVHVVNNKAYADFSVNQNKVCKGDAVGLSNINVPDDVKTVKVDFGDGYFTTGGFFSHAYTKAGTYTITMDIENSCGNKASASDTVQIVSSGLGLEDVSYYVDPSYILCPGDKFEFSTGSYDSIRWNFGGGKISSSGLIELSYDTSGYHTFSLTVGNGCGVDSTVTDSVLVMGNLSPQVYWFEAYPTTVYPGVNVYFEFDGDYTKYNWDFGDTLTSDLQSPVHAFKYPGTYNVKLNATDGCGNAYRDSMQIVVSDTLKMPLPGIVATPDTQCIGDPVEFDAVSNNLINGILNIKDYSFEWEFTDTTLYGVTVYHSFQSEGKQMVTLVVKNLNGNEVTLKDSVEIGSSVHSNENSLNLKGGQSQCPGDSVMFTINPTSKTCTIDFGDGAQSTSFKNAIFNGVQTRYIGHKYAQAGNYKVKASLTDGCGNSISDSTSVTLESYADNLGQYAIDNNHIFCRKEKVALSFEGTPGVDIDFGDGSDTTLTLPLLATLYHSYQDSGVYSVRIKQFNACGDTITNKELVFVGSCIEETTPVRHITENNVTVYPNPVDHMLYIQLSQDMTGSGSDYTLFDLNGREVKQGTIPFQSQLAGVDMNGLPAGMYFLRIRSQNWNLVKKVLKK